MGVLRILAIVWLAQSGASPQVRTATLQGAVVKVISNEPIANVAVELRSLDAGRARVYSTTTARDGRFGFRLIPPGRYQLTAMRGGYVRGDYGLRGPGASGITITLAAGQRMADVRLAMRATGTIAGRITDLLGEAVGNVHVKALRYSYQDGRVSLIDVKSVFTNDLGEYRLGWLPPGMYNVSALHPDARVTALNLPEVINSATIVGPETKAYASSVMITWSASPRRRAGPETAGPVTMRITGTMPEQAESAFAAWPQPWRAGMPSRMSAPLEPIVPTSGIPFVRAVSAATAIVDDACADSAPRRTSASTSSSTTGRSSIRPTSARAAPGVRVRRPIVRAGLVLSRARGVHCFLARIEGQPIAAAALNLSNGVAILAGATTIPAARRRGAQRALLGTRLAFAAARGIDLAMVVTQPQSGSMRNAEREGFFPVYTRAKWRLE